MKIIVRGVNNTFVAFDADAEDGSEGRGANALEAFLDLHTKLNKQVTPRDLEEALITVALARANNNAKEAGGLIGVSLRKMQYRMAERRQRAKVAA